MANHAGWLDIPVLSAVAPVSFVAKHEINLWPFFGTLARLQRTVFIRRERSKALEDRDNIRRRLLQGDALVIFPEGTSGDGNRVLRFKSALLSAAELAIGEAENGHVRHVAIQPVSVAYVSLHGLPMGRENRPLFAWYGDMDLLSHLWGAIEAGPIDVVVELHEPLTIDQAGGRKELAAAAETAVRGGLVRALSGTSTSAPVPARDEDLLEALEANDAEIDDAA
jgi:1-acyl-sn-glycerol-3-phosphate acyltransferase